MYLATGFEDVSTLGVFTARAAETVLFGACLPALKMLMNDLSERVPIMSALLERRDLPLPTRRSVITALSAVDGRDARDALLRLADEPAPGPAALTSLLRMRGADEIDAVDPAALAGIVAEEIRKGLIFSLVSSGLRRAAATNPRNMFVADELDNLRMRSVHRVVRVLALSYDPARLSAVGAALVSHDVSRGSNDLELLEGSISGATAAMVMPFMEIAAQDFPEGPIMEQVADAADVIKYPGEHLTKEKDWWPHSLGLHVLGRDEEISTPGRSKDLLEKEDTMIPLIEKVMILKGSELFRNFPGADLAGIASLAHVVHLEADEVVFNQGEYGDALYMVVSGGIRITRGVTELAILGSREGFGEMAILDRETRSATATAAEATTLLRIDQDPFDQLIEQNPAVARGIYRVLTERLRNTLAQVAAG